MAKHYGKVLVTGGAGYVGSLLVPALIHAGWTVKVIDTFEFGDFLPTHPSLEKIKGDIRDIRMIRYAVSSCDTVIHLANKSNDPEYKTDRALGMEVNLVAFRPLVDICIQHKVRKFIFASSCSVYGNTRTTEPLTETYQLNPLTDYAYCKMICEQQLSSIHEPDFRYIIVRPATICGFSPRLRLELSVNQMISDAYFNNCITAKCPGNIRPTLHIKDMVKIYLMLVQSDLSDHDHHIFNAAYENRTVLQTALMIREHMNHHCNINIHHAMDMRSYAVSSSRLEADFGFTPSFSTADAVKELRNEFETMEYKLKGNEKACNNIS